ncbi:MAG: hypothetical protein WCG28_04015 [bacterium]
MTIEEIKGKLNSIGNIKVIFEPKVYNETLIPKKELQNILEKSKVGLRGWSFPHIPIEDREDSKRPYSIGNGVEFYISWQGIIEASRFYQSGQFISKFALREDTMGELYGKPLEAGKYLDFLGLIYKITEITLFVKNLIENTNIEEGNLIIEINNTRDRELESIFSQNIFSFNAGYICRMNKIMAPSKIYKEKITTDYLEISRELIKSIFDDFNWKNYSEQMIQTHQENLINRRI